MIAALVVATGAAIVFTQRFRHEGPVISLVSTKERQCPRAQRAPGVPVSFLLTDGDTLDVRIVGAGDETTVRTLARGAVLEGDRRYCFPWNGRRDDGTRAAPGAYRLQVSLQEADRVATAGQVFRLARAPVPGEEQP